MADGYSQAKKKKNNKLKWLKKNTQTGRKAEPVASDRLLRNRLFILCSGWFIFVRGMDLIQEFITKLQMQSRSVFLTPKRAKKMNRGLGELATLTQAQWEEIFKRRSRAFLQLFFSTSSDNYP